MQPMSDELKITQSGDDHRCHCTKVWIFAGGMALLAAFSGFGWYAEVVQHQRVSIPHETAVQNLKKQRERLTKTSGLLSPVDVDGVLYWTPLLLSIARGDSASVRQLLLDGADPNELNGDGENPLCLSAALGQQDIVEYLLAAKADPRLKHPLGSTFLQAAVIGGNIRVVEMALQSGIDPNAKDRLGSTALYQAAMYQKPEIVALLLQSGANPRTSGPGGIELLRALTDGAGDPELGRSRKASRELIQAALLVSPDKK